MSDDQLNPNPVSPEGERAGFQAEPLPESEAPVASSPSLAPAEGQEAAPAAEGSEAPAPAASEEAAA